MESTWCIANSAFSQETWSFNDKLRCVCMITKDAMTRRCASHSSSHSPKHPIKAVSLWSWWVSHCIVCQPIAAPKPIASCIGLKCYFSKDFGTCIVGCPSLIGVWYDRRIGTYGRKLHCLEGSSCCYFNSTESSGSCSLAEVLALKICGGETSNRFP